MYEKKKYLLNKLLHHLLMNSTESKIGLLIEDAQTVLERGVKRGAVKMDVQLEIRTLSFWRALTAECIATFLYSLLVSLMSVSSADSHPGTSQLYCGLVAGLATATLATIFLPVSGAHINPALSLSAAIIHRVSPLRAGAYILAQTGGAIAGASVVLGLFGTSDISRYQNIGMAQFGLEFLLTFMIVLAYLRVTEEHQQQSDRNLNPAISIGVAYMTALVAYKGTVNPALALGQAFVLGSFSSLWVFWLGPVVGGCSAALCQEYIFSEQKEIQLSLTNVKNVKEDQKENTDGHHDDNDDKSKDMKDEVKQGTKETGYSVNYKQPLTEQMVVPTPPLPPWKGKKRVQRSYSSEMLTSDSYYNVNEYCGAETETRQLPTESSGYHSGSLSKQKSATATGSRKACLQRTNSHNKHSNSNSGRNKHMTTSTKDNKTFKSSSCKSPQTVTRSHHSHDSHYFVDY